MSTGARVVGLLLLASVVPCCGGSGGGGGEDPFIRLTDFQLASVVVGQQNETGGTPNAGGGAAPNAVGLSSPLGAVAGSVYVPDTSNHRVLGFAGVPTSDGAAADFVLGQPDFATGVSGIGPSGFTLPAEAVVADGRLFLTDSGNSRVLIWNSAPTSDAPADVVVGQADFTSEDFITSETTLRAPTGIAVADGRLFVADGGNHRVLVWNSIPTSNGAPADLVLGQTSFGGNVGGRSASQIEGPSDVSVVDGRIFVADSSNNRVLVWDSLPSTNGAPADLVLGQADFTSGVPAGGATGMSTPTGVHATESQLFVVDSSNHRVLVYDSLPTVSQPVADHVLGQLGFVNTAPNDRNQDGVSDGDPSASTLRGPVSVVAIGTRLFVTDRSNHRVLIFQSQ